MKSPSVFSDTAHFFRSPVTQTRFALSSLRSAVVVAAPGPQFMHHALVYQLCWDPAQTEVESFGSDRWRSDRPALMKRAVTVICASLWCATILVAGLIPKPESPNAPPRSHHLPTSRLHLRPPSLFRFAPHRGARAFLRLLPLCRPPASRISSLAKLVVLPCSKHHHMIRA